MRRRDEMSHSAAAVCMEGRMDWVGWNVIGWRLDRIGTPRSLNLYLFYGRCVRWILRGCGLWFIEFFFLFCSFFRLVDGWGGEVEGLQGI